MMPRAFRATLRPGLVGVRIPGRVGKWKVSERATAIKGSLATELFLVESTTFSNVQMVVDKSRRVVCGIIRGDWKTAARQEGFVLK